MSTLKLPFQLERPSSTTPATTASDVDITAIDGYEATNVQEALEEIVDKTIAHKFLTESAMDDLTASSAEEGVIYISLEGYTGTDFKGFGSYFGFTFG